MLEPKVTGDFLDSLKAIESTLNAINLESPQCAVEMLSALKLIVEMLRTDYGDRFSNWPEV